MLGLHVVLQPARAELTPDADCVKPPHGVCTGAICESLTQTTPAIAAARSASGKTMFGDLPPSSTLTRYIESAADRSTNRPVADEPVNDTLSTPGCATSVAPVRAPPVTT